MIVTLILNQNEVDKIIKKSVVERLDFGVQFGMDNVEVNIDRVTDNSYVAVVTVKAGE